MNCSFLQALLLVFSGVLVQTVVGLTAHKAVNRLPFCVEDGPKWDSPSFKEFAVLFEFGRSPFIHVHMDDVKS